MFGLRKSSCGFICGSGLLLLVGCQGDDAPAPEAPAPPAPPAQAAPPAPALAAVPPSPTVAPREALPRAAGGVSLGMTFAQAQETLGKLTCHANEAGFQVCNTDNTRAGELQHLELYLHHDRVISVSYEGPAPSSAWDALNKLIDRYGSPSLSGVRERDKTGRLHEIYGWKDDASLYSVRFMWKNAEADKPELIGTAIALWDRKGYQQWEAEAKRAAPSTAPAAPPGEPT